MVHEGGDGLLCLTKQLARAHRWRVRLSKDALVMVIFDQIIAANLSVLSACGNDRDFAAKVNKAFGNEWRGRRC